MPSFENNWIISLSEDCRKLYISVVGFQMYFFFFVKWVC
jgi:hypothetical protein